jgi:hypothetical protein
MLIAAPDAIAALGYCAQTQDRSAAVFTDVQLIAAVQFTRGRRDQHLAHPFDVGQGFHAARHGGGELHEERRNAQKLLQPHGDSTH